MGFDLHGMNPETSTPEPTWKKGDPWITEGNRRYLDPKIEKEYRKHMDAVIEWQDNSEGAYFRSNIWFWRPLWSYVCSVCEFITDKDMNEGFMNNGHTIAKTKSKRIASRLRKLFNRGDVHAYNHYYKHKQSKLNDNDWNRNYPFDVKHVLQFANFCEKSGGFQIW